MIAHSVDLHELSHGAQTGTTGSMTLADLRLLCPRLGTLEEALTFFAEEAEWVGVHVDVKSPSALPEVARALARFGLVAREPGELVPPRCAARPRTSRAAGAGRRVCPRDRLGIDGRRGLDHVVDGGLRALRRITPALVNPLLARARATVLVLHHGLVSAAAVRQAHARGAAVVTWTVDEPDDLDRVEKAGVDAVVTNNPSIFVSTLTT